MSTRRSILLVVLANTVITAVLLTAVPAVAGLGDSLIFGTSNNGGTETTELITHVEDGPGLRIENDGGPARAAVRINTLCPTTDTEKREKCSPGFATNTGGLVKHFNADKLDGLNAAEILAEASDADTLDGKSAGQLLADASDADTLDGLHASDILETASDAKTLNGLGANQILDQASDADTLDGLHASDILDQASDAQTLDGQTANQLLSGVVSTDQLVVAADVSENLPDTDNFDLAVVLNAPTNGVLLVDASVDITHLAVGATSVLCQVLHGPDLPTAASVPGSAMAVSVEGVDRAICSTMAYVPVSAGSHAVKIGISLNNDLAMQLLDGFLRVVFLPTA